MIQCAMLVFALQKTTIELCCSICIQHGKFRTQLQGCHVEVNPSPRCCKTSYCLQVQYSFCASKFSKGLNILATIGSPILLVHKYKLQPRRDMARSSFIDVEDVLEDPDYHGHLCKTKECQCRTCGILRWV
jgi:hypothetical protein